MQEVDWLESVFEIAFGYDYNYRARSAEERAAIIGVTCQKKAPPKKYVNLAIYLAGNNKVTTKMKKIACFRFSSMNKV